MSKQPLFICTRDDHSRQALTSTFVFVFLLFNHSAAYAQTASSSPADSSVPGAPATTGSEGGAVPVDERYAPPTESKEDPLHSSSQGPAPIEPETHPESPSADSSPNASLPGHSPSRPHDNSSEHGTTSQHPTPHHTAPRKVKRPGVKAYIYPGNVEVGGSMDFRLPFGGPSTAGSSLSLTLGTQLKYYVLLGFAVGGAIEGGISSNQSSSSTTTTQVNAQDLKLGAALSYYFFTHERITLGLSEVFYYVYSRATSSVTDSSTGSTSLSTTANGYALSRTSLYFDYFLNPAIALGPSVNYEREIANAQNTGHLNRFSTQIGFKLFL
jgi:hypothetical protein